MIATANLFTMTEDEIIAAASEIVNLRAVEALRAATDETNRLFRLYASKRDKEPHNLGKPQKLTVVEALLLVALERNKYNVECRCPNKGKWIGDATCRFNARGVAMSWRAESRQDLLLSLWASVSDQDGRIGGVLLTEDHMRGSIVQRDIRELNRELREQEAHQTPGEPGAE